MKRILCVELNEDGTVGGSHRVLVDLVTRLSERHRPLVLFYEDNLWVGRLEKMGIEVHVWDDVRRDEQARLNAGGKLSTLAALPGFINSRRRFIADHRIDLVHLNNSPFQGLDDWLPAARWAGIPCVTYAAGDANRRPGPVQQHLIRKFDAVLPASRLVAEGLVRQGIDPARITVAYPGIDLDELASRDYRPAADIRAEFGVGEGQVLATMVGNIRRWKGQHVVVEALAAMEPELRDRIRVLMVGDVGAAYEAEFAEIRERIAELGLGEAILFTGRRDDVPDLLEASEIAIHASTTPEPFGLVVLEGLAHGCAVLAAGAGGPVEMVTPGSGLLWDSSRPEELARHLERLIQDPQARADLGRAARLAARRFHVAEHVRTVEAIYDRLFARVPDAGKDGA